MNQKTQESNCPKSERNELNKARLDEFCTEIQHDIEQSVSFPSLTYEQKQVIIKTIVETLPLDVNDGRKEEISKKIKTVIINNFIKRGFDEKSINILWGGDYRSESNSNIFDNPSRLIHLGIFYLIPSIEDGVKLTFNADTNRLISATLFALINKEEREKGEKSAENLNSKFSEIYFTNLNPHRNVINDDVELLSLTKKGSVLRKRFFDPIFEESSLLKELEMKGPIEKIDQIDAITDDVLEGIYNECPTNVNETVIAFENLIKDQDTPSFIRIIASEKIDLIYGAIEKEAEEQSQFESLFDDEDVEWYPSATKSIEEYEAEEEKKRRNDPEYIKYKTEQLELHSKFTGFDENDKLALVAPGYCAKLSYDNKSYNHGFCPQGYNVRYLIDSEGNRTEISNWQAENTIGISKDEALLINTAHIPNIKSKIESELGTPLNIIPLETQLHFLRFMMEAGNNRYEKLTKELVKFENESDKLALIDSFLSLEFGEDFGDTVLSIAEHAEPTKSVEIFKIINKYREVSKKFGDLYRDFDPELASASEKAMNERLTDLLATVEHVAKNGPNTFDVSPAKNNEGYVHDGKFDIRIETLVEVIDVMQSFLNSQIMLQEILADKKTKIIKTTVDNPDSLRLTSQTYRLINEEKGFAQLHVREYGSESYDRTREYGNSSGTEATISWLINPLNSHKLPEPKDQDCISVRFDREGRLVNEKSNSQNRSPIRNDGSISLDIGSVIGDASKMSTKLGRMIAAGNELRAKERDEDTFLNHNTNYFDQKYGMADNFAELVRHIKNGVERDYEKVAKNKLAQLAIKINSKREDVSRRGLAG